MASLGNADRFLKAKVILDDKAAQGKLNRLGISGRNVMAGLGVAAAGAAIAVAGIGVAGIRANVELNKAMADVQTLLGEAAGVDRIYELKDAVQDLSGELGTTTDDLASGLYQVVSAFGDSSEAIDQLAISAKAAKAGVATTTDAINLISAVTKAYGDTSVDAQMKVADFAFQTVKLGQTTFPELAASIGKAAPLMADMGITMEEAFGILATGTGVTGNAAEVNTQLAASITALMKPNKDMSIMLETIGFESGRAAVESLGLVGTYEKLRKQADATGIEMVKLTGRKEAAVLMAALLGTQYDTLQIKTEAMTNSEGAMTEAFKAQTEGINEQGFKWDVITSKWDIFKQKLGEVATGEGADATTLLDDISTGVDTMIKALEDPNGELRQFITDIKALAEMLWDTAMAIKGFADSVRDYSDAYYDSAFYRYSPAGLWQSNMMEEAGQAGLGAGTTDYEAGSGQFTPHSERGGSAIHVIVDNADTGSMGLLEAISG